MNFLFPRCQCDFIRRHHSLLGFRHILLRLPRLHAHYIHVINLLQRLPLRFEQEKVYSQRRRTAARSEDVSVTEVDVGRDEGGEEGDEKVPGPVRGRGHGHALGPIAGWEELARDGPDHGAPGAGEGGDE